MSSPPLRVRRRCHAPAPTGTDHFGHPVGRSRASAATQECLPPRLGTERRLINDDPPRSGAGNGNAKRRLGTSREGQRVVLFESRIIGARSNESRSERRFSCRVRTRPGRRSPSFCAPGASSWLPSLGPIRPPALSARSRASRLAFGIASSLYVGLITRRSQFQILPRHQRSSPGQRPFPTFQGGASLALENGTSLTGCLTSCGGTGAERRDGRPAGHSVDHATWL